LIALLTKQLQGKLEHIAVQGTAYSFRFPAKAQNMGGELK
jgi:two-component sensor histidine kinase